MGLLENFTLVGKFDAELFKAHLLLSTPDSSVRDFDSLIIKILNFYFYKLKFILLSNNLK